jgi:uncharacterized membrane protein
MSRDHQKTQACPVCREARPSSSMVPGDVVHGPVLELIHKAVPDWSGAEPICLACLNRFRAEYVSRALEEERGEVSALDQEVIRSLREHDLISENFAVTFDQQLTAGQRLADRVAEFGGSWRFIVGFGLVLVAWITLNSLTLAWRPFDPYPYILLNLILSCLAAVQAPVIMMSQNRQEAKDRLRAQNDYRVNLKAELEIRQLHWKVDQLLTHQWRRLLEIQQIQTELMEELVHRPRRGPAR